MKSISKKIMLKINSTSTHAFICRKAPKLSAKYIIFTTFYSLVISSCNDESRYFLVEHPQLFSRMKKNAKRRIG